jgi:hypothetical protein
MSGQSMYSKSVQTWSPFVGCEFDCSYCVASYKRQAKRQKNRCMRCYRFDPHEHEARLKNSIAKTGPGEFIFVCAMGDISFAGRPYIERIKAVIMNKPDRTFLIQTKNPQALRGIWFPENVILGITLETNRNENYTDVSKAPAPTDRYYEFCALPHPRKMITVEPIMEFDEPLFSNMIKAVRPEIVWIGYETKGSVDLPEPDMRKTLDLGAELIWCNIKVLLKHPRRKRNQVMLATWCYILGKQ